MQRIPLVYPSSDGKRMADNTLQYRWMVTIEGGLEAIFRDRADVFVAGDLLWYPVEGMSISVAPDVLVAIGRPKGDRKSYLQWEEDNVAPQVVFEILSESNTHYEMMEKQDFYEEHGVEEYYEYDPIRKKLRGWRHDGSNLRKVPQMHGWVSPLTKIRFAMEPDLVIYGPDGKRFLSYPELVEDRNRAYQRAERVAAENEKLRSVLRAQGIDPDDLLK